MLADRLGGMATAVAVPFRNHSSRAGSRPASKRTRRWTTPLGTTRSGGHAPISASCPATQVRASSGAEAPVSIHTARVISALLPTAQAERPATTSAERTRANRSLATKAAIGEITGTGTLAEVGNQ